jgi:hypothetical protein
MISLLYLSWIPIYCQSLQFATDPQNVVREAIKIFAAESRRPGIRLSVAVDKSVDELKVNWVL